MTQGQLLKYSRLTDQQWNYSRWLTTNSLAVALWVISDQEGDIMIIFLWTIT